MDTSYSPPPTTPSPSASATGSSVLFISNDPSLFDPASPARLRMRAYAARVGSLHIVSRGAGEDLQEGALHLHPVGDSKLFLLGRLKKRAKQIIAEHAIAVVSAQDPFELGSVARKVCAGTHVKLHIQIHTDFLSPWFVKGVRWPMAIKNRIRCAVAGKNLRSAHGVRVVSKRIADAVTRKYPRLTAPITIIPIAVDPALPEPVTFEDVDCSFVFFAVGRLEAEKRVEDLIAAMKFVNERFTHACLVIAGDGRERKRLERCARNCGVSETVHFLGARADARALMRSAHCFVQASAYEGYGLTLIEAALSRVPIVTTDVGIVDEVFSATEDAYVVPIGNPGALAYAMLSVMTNAQDRTAMVRSSESRVLAHLASNADPVGAIVADLLRTAAGVPAERTMTAVQ